jgi:hypothetical protein
MQFTVTARRSARGYAYQHASVLSALDQGMSLVAAGMSDVTITDGNGRAKSPSALYQALFGLNPATSGSISSAVAPGQAA